MRFPAARNGKPVVASATVSAQNHSLQEVTAEVGVFKSKLLIWLKALLHPLELLLDGDRALHETFKSDTLIFGAGPPA